MVPLRTHEVSAPNTHSNTIFHTTSNDTASTVSKTASDATVTLGKRSTKKIRVTPTPIPSDVSVHSEGGSSVIDTHSVKTSKGNKKRQRRASDDEVVQTQSEHQPVTIEGTRVALGRANQLHHLQVAWEKNTSEVKF
jgi:hypothetical protein